jgi:hypothetical protein
MADEQIQPDCSECPTLVTPPVLYALHQANTRRLDELETTAKAMGGTLLQLQLSNGRIETKLDAALKLDDKMDELTADVNKAKGAGILGGVAVTLVSVGAAVWSAIHGK